MEEYDETAAPTPLPPCLPPESTSSCNTSAAARDGDEVVTIEVSVPARVEGAISQTSLPEKVLSGTVGSDDTGGTVRYDARESPVRRESQLGSRAAQRACARQISCSGTTTTDTFPTMTKRQCMAYAMLARSGRREAVSNGTRNGSLEMFTMIDTGSQMDIFNSRDACLGEHREHPTLTMRCHSIGGDISLKMIAYHSVLKSWVWTSDLLSYHLVTMKTLEKTFNMTLEQVQGRHVGGRSKLRTIAFVFTDLTGRVLRFAVESSTSRKRDLYLAKISPLEHDVEVNNNDATGTSTEDRQKSGTGAPVQDTVHGSGADQETVSVTGTENDTAYSFNKFAQNEKQSGLTVREIHQARLAFEVVSRLAFPSFNDAAQMFRQHAENFRSDRLLPKDFRNAEQLYGGELSHGGKTVRQTTSLLATDIPAYKIHTERPQTAHCDLFYVGGIGPYLLTLMEPVYHLYVRELSAKKGETIVEGLKIIFGYYRARGMTIELLRVDGESGLAKFNNLETILGCRVEALPPLVHDGPIERRVRIFKERLRCLVMYHRAVYQVEIPRSLVAAALTFISDRLNAMPCYLRGDRTPAREILIGRPSDAETEVRFGFGEYVDCTVPSEKTDKSNVYSSRDESALTLLPVTGGWLVMLIATWTVVKRSAMKRGKMSDVTRALINDRAKREEKLYTHKDLATMPWHLRGKILSDDEETLPLDDPVMWYSQQIQAPVSDVVTPQSASGGGSATTTPTSEETVVLEKDGKLAPLIAAPAEHISEAAESPAKDGNSETDGQVQEPAAPDDKPELDVPHPKSKAHKNPFPPPMTTRQKRRHLDGVVDKFTKHVAAIVQQLANAQRVIDSREQEQSVTRDVDDDGSKRPKDRQARHTNAMSYTLDQALKDPALQELAVAAAIQEVAQFVDQKVFDGVHYTELTSAQRRKILASQMLITVKHLPDGTWERVKARLIIRGDRQDKSSYEQTSSPTVMNESVMLCLGIAALQHKRIAAIDLVGAYLRTDQIEGAEVIMELRPALAEILVHRYPEYAPFVDPETGRFYGRLNKIVYGDVVGALALYQKLCGDLESLGFRRSSKDSCVFNREKDGELETLLVYVDDILILMSQEGIERFITEFRAKWPEITVQMGPKVGHLGVEIDMSVPGKVSLMMTKHLNKIRESWKDLHSLAVNAGEISDNLYNVRDTVPCNVELFNIKDDSVALSRKSREAFHSIVMAIFYVAKRVKPETLTVCSFLAGRVKAPTRDDLAKLRRLVSYLESTKEMAFMMAPRGIYLEMYIDASHAVHRTDGRSHTGIVLTLGGAPFYCSSSRQELNTRSSTESEIVAMSSASSMIQWARQFMQEQGFKDILPAHCWEDNESALKLWEKGYSTAKETKHIETRYFYMTDLSRRRIVTLEHIGTEDQLADILTKGLSESKFIMLRDRLFGSYSKLHELKRNIVSATQKIGNINRKVKFSEE